MGRARVCGIADSLLFHTWDFGTGSGGADVCGVLVVEEMFAGEVGEGELATVAGWRGRSSRLSRVGNSRLGIGEQGFAKGALCAGSRWCGRRGGRGRRVLRRGRRGTVSGGRRTRIFGGLQLLGAWRISPMLRGRLFRW